MDNIVRFNPEKKCVADSPPAEEAGARESDLVEFNEYAVPSEYKLEHFLIPPADRKWRCGFCGNLGAPHEFSWHQEVWQDDLLLKEKYRIAPGVAESWREIKCNDDVE